MSYNSLNDSAYLSVIDVKIDLAHGASTYTRGACNTNMGATFILVLPIFTAMNPNATQPQWWYLVEQKRTYKNAIANELFLFVSAHLATRSLGAERAEYTT